MRATLFIASSFLLAACADSGPVIVLHDGSALVNATIYNAKGVTIETDATQLGAFTRDNTFTDDPPPKNLETAPIPYRNAPPTSFRPVGAPEPPAQPGESNEDARGEPPDGQDGPPTFEPLRPEDLPPKPDTY